eukprot:165247-Rhodomonas_salina.1
MELVLSNVREGFCLLTMDVGRAGARDEEEGGAGGADRAGDGRRQEDCLQGEGRRDARRPHRRRHPRRLRGQAQGPRDAQARALSSLSCALYDAFSPRFVGGVEIMVGGWRDGAA